MLNTREIQLSPINQLMNNQTALENGQIVSRIFTDAAGRSFRLTFIVSIVDGEVMGQLVSAQEIARSDLGKETANVQSCYFLAFSCPKVVASTPYVSPFSFFVSPYFSLDFLINSQPTRAPSRV